MPTDLTRRSFLIAAGAMASMTAMPAWALNTNQAKALIDTVVARINAIINSGKSEPAMIRDFERIFTDYGDVRYISAATLGPPARTASRAQMNAYSKAFTTYISRKYGRRFREFIGGGVVVQRAKPFKSFFEVETMTTLAGTAPFRVSFFVSDKSGRNLFFDMRVEGISLIKAEREEIGNLLERRGGNLDRLIRDLPSLG